MFKKKTNKTKDFNDDDDNVLFCIIIIKYYFIFIFNQKYNN